MPDQFPWTHSHAVVTCWSVEERGRECISETLPSGLVSTGMEGGVEGIWLQYRKQRSEEGRRVELTRHLTSVAVTGSSKVLSSISSDSTGMKIFPPISLPISPPISPPVSPSPPLRRGSLKSSPLGSSSSSMAQNSAFLCYSSEGCFPNKAHRKSKLIGRWTLYQVFAAM